MTRRHRANDELAEHVAGVLALAEVEWDPAIPAWIEVALAEPEQTSILRLTGSGSYLTYNPSADDLALIFDLFVGDPELDEAGARDWFLGLVEDAQIAGLIGPLQVEVERVGWVRRQTGHANETTPSLPRTEGWRFEVTRTHAGLPVLGAGLAAVILADGRLASLRLSDVTVEHQEWSVATPTPELLAQRWTQALTDLHRQPQAVHLGRVQWAFALDATQVTTTVSPRLIVEHVLGYGQAAALTPSRQDVVALSVQPDKPAALLSP